MYGFSPFKLFRLLHGTGSNTSIVPVEDCKEISTNAIKSFDDLEKIPMILCLHREGASNLGTKSLRILDKLIDTDIIIEGFIQ